jgi:glycosyltransferase involved in cell wall biosynthesis
VRATGQRLRVAWVVHQYGAEIGGGSETLCRTVTEFLAEDVDSTVLSTTARDYDPWLPFYPAGEESLNGVRILRFQADQAPPDELRARYEDAHAHPQDARRGRLWLDALGPRAPGLLEHLRDQASEYDVLCAVPYVFATTLAAFETFPGPKLLVPCAHDEPALSLDVYQEVFDLADAFAFNTGEEAALVEERFGTDRRSTDTIGFPIGEVLCGEPSAFRTRFGIEGPYLLCIGRIDASKGTDLLLDLRARTRARTPDHTLVLMGQPIMDIAVGDDIVVTGHVDEQSKADAIAGASAIVLPSPYESLSIVALEAWAQGVPVLANATSPVLLGQVRRSGGGLWYRDEHDYATMIRLLLELPDLGPGLGSAGRAWTVTTYSPQTVKIAWLALLEAVAVGSATPAS